MTNVEVALWLGDRWTGFSGSKSPPVRLNRSFCRVSRREREVKIHSELKNEHSPTSNKEHLAEDNWSEWGGRGEHNKNCDRRRIEEEVNVCEWHEPSELLKRSVTTGHDSFTVFYWKNRWNIEGEDSFVERI